MGIRCQRKKDRVFKETRGKKMADVFSYPPPDFPLFDRPEREGWLMMKDLQIGFPCLPAPVPTEGGAGRPMNVRMARTTVSISDSVNSGKRGRERIS
jgi:hypothetical protein